jgi:mono/diheme cytochrome c family protein
MAMRVLALLAVLAAIPALSAGSARMLYLQHCAGCHQADGSASPLSNIPALKDNTGYFLRSPEGRAYLVQVPGTSNSPLSDAEVAVLLNWMIPAFSRDQLPAGEFTPYSAEEVGRYRAHKPDDITQARARVVKALQEQGNAVQ